MAITFKDNKSNYLLHQTMASLIDAMVDMKTVIDLRNETSVHGKIVEVDGYMNVELEDCIFQNSRGELYPFENFFVRGRNIRYVHVPDNLSALDLIEDHFKVKPRIQVDRNKKNTFKAKRAQKYQASIIADLSSK